MQADEFWMCTPRSFANKIRGYHRKLERENKEQWVLARYQAYCSMMVHIESKQRKTMQQMLPLPWDEVKQARKVTKEDTKKLLEKWQVKASVQ